MDTATLEHINITVSDPKQTAAMLRRLFGWHIRWEGASMDNGYTVHVGTDSQYVALYTTGVPKLNETAAHKTLGGFNHFAVVVENLDDAEIRVKSEGFTPHNHGDYDPGNRFYFHDADGIEYEVVSYT